jgi:hypothetical protein
MDYKIFTWGGYGLFGMTFTYIINRCYEEENDEEEEKESGIGEETGSHSHPPLKKEIMNNMHYYLIIYFFLVAIVKYGVRFVDIVAISIGFFTCEVLDPLTLWYKQKSKYMPQESRNEDSNDHSDVFEVNDTEEVISAE